MENKTKTHFGIERTRERRTERESDRDKCTKTTLKYGEKTGLLIEIKRKDVEISFLSKSKAKDNNGHKHKTHFMHVNECGYTDIDA